MKVECGPVNDQGSGLSLDRGKYFYFKQRLLIAHVLIAVISCNTKQLLTKGVTKTFEWLLKTKINRRRNYFITESFDFGACYCGAMPFTIMFFLACIDFFLCTMHYVRKDTFVLGVNKSTVTISDLQQY
jgi:hypothetical protein